MSHALVIWGTWCSLTIVPPGVPESVCRVAAEKSEELENTDNYIQERKKGERARSLLKMMANPSTVSNAQVVHAARKAIVA